MIVARYSIALHRRDEELLKLIQTYFGGAGRISSHGLNTLLFRVNSLKDNLATVIPHFDKYPRSAPPAAGVPPASGGLITQKFADYILFKKAYLLICSKEHLTSAGILELVALKASSN